MSELPEWLVQAIAHVGTAPPMSSPLAHAESLPTPGDLRPLVSMDVNAGPTPRIVLVMDVDPDVRFATIALTTNDTDLATDDDAFVPAAVSGAPFDLLVELDVQGTARPCQLGRKLGHIDIDLLRDRDRAPRGVPVRTEEDERVAFKNAEVETLYALAGEAMRAAEAGKDRLLELCDPDAILRLARCNPSILSELIGEDAAPLPGAVAEQLLFETTGRDEFVLLEGLLQRSLETETPYGGAGDRVTAWHPSGDHELLGATIASAVGSDACEVRVATIRSVWGSETSAPTFCVLRSRRVPLALGYVEAE